MEGLLETLGEASPGRRSGGGA